MHCMCVQIELHELWHYRALHKGTAYNSCTLRLNPYYRENNLHRLQIFRFSNCHSIYYYKMQIHISINTYSILDYEFPFAAVLWSRIIWGVSSSPFQNLPLVILQMSTLTRGWSMKLSCLKSLCAQSRCSTALGYMVFYDQRILTIGLCALVPIWCNTSDSLAHHSSPYCQMKYFFHLSSVICSTSKRPVRLYTGRKLLWQQVWIIMPEQSLIDPVS